MKRRILALSILALVAAAGYLGGRSAPPGLVLPTASAQSGAAAIPTPLPPDLSAEELRDIAVFREASASVVFITSLQRRRDLFSANVFEIPQGSGSGFIWDDRGHVVTNFHVIQHGDAFSVTLKNQTSYTARVIGAAPDKDLAVLQIEAPAEELVPLTRGRSSNLVVGQRLLAVGNPFGLDHTLTVGVLSALGRELRSPGGRIIRDVIQTDAAINPGNSGGPVLDSSGRLIGVSSAIYSPSGAFAGIGFAVPVDTVARLVPQLIESGKPVKAGIGISLVPDSFATGAGIAGAAVYQVAPGLPAERAGIEGISRNRSGRILFGDVIVAVDGKAVKNSDDLFYALESAGVGRKVTLRIDRNGRQRDAQVVLVELE